MASWQNGLQRLQFDKMIYKDYNLTKWQVNKMASWQNGKLTKFEVDKMAIWQNGKSAKWDFTRKDNALLFSINRNA
jgi:hypothetical protein